MHLPSFVFCCLGNLFFIDGAEDHVEILEERKLLKEFMKYPLNNPKKDLDLRVLSLHLRPSTRNKSIRNGLGKLEQSPHGDETTQLGGRRKDTVTAQAKPETNYEVPQMSQTKRQQELEYSKLREKYSKRQGLSKNRKKPRRPAKHRKPEVTLESEEKGYKEVKHKNLRSRRIELFTRSGRKKEPKEKRQSESSKMDPTNKEFQRHDVPGSWGGVRHLALPPMIDGEVLSDEALLTYNQLEGENYYNTQHVDVLQKGEEAQQPVIWEESKERVPLDQYRHSNLKFFSESGGKATYKEPRITEDPLEETESSLETATNEHFNYFPNGDTEPSSLIVLPTSNGVKNSQLPPDNPQLWRMVVAMEDIPLIDIYSDTIPPAEIHTGSSEADPQTHLWSHDDILLKAEGSGIYNSMTLDHEDKLVTLTPNKDRTQTYGLLKSKATATILPSSYNNSPSLTDTKYTEIPRVTSSQELHDGIFSPLAATMNHNPGPIFCKPGYKEYDGVCKSQCDIGGIYCGDSGQCVIVENIGAMCRCQQVNSLCFGGECCRSSLTTFQLACVIGTCCILLSVFLGSLPYLIRRMDIKAISKSVRTRLWISTLMPRSNSSSSSQSADSTVSSDYESLSDHSAFHCTKEMARNFSMWQSERTRL